MTIDSLKDRQEFELLYKNAYRFHTPYFTLYISKIPYLSKKLQLHPKHSKLLKRILSRGADLYLGLSVSKKIGNAPKRNLYKRQMRSIVRNESFRGYMIVFAPKVGFENLGFKEFHALCLKALKRDFQATIQKRFPA